MTSTEISLRQIGTHTVIGTTSLGAKAHERIGRFLEAHKHLLETVQEMGRPYYAIENHRVPAFIAYVERNGFRVAA